MGAYRRAELRSADAMSNPYIAFALMIYAGICGIERNMQLPSPADINLFAQPPEVLSGFKRLPEDLAQARAKAAESDFIKEHLPDSVLKAYSIV